MPKPLNVRQSRFCEEYVKDLNATQAAARAGYSLKTAHSCGPRLLEHAGVQARLTELLRKRTERTQIDADWVLTRIGLMLDTPVRDLLTEAGALRPVNEWPDGMQYRVTGVDIEEIWDREDEEKRQIGVIKKVKLADPWKGLELAGRHVNVQAYMDRYHSKNEIVDVVLQTFIRDPLGNLVEIPATQRPNPQPLTIPGVIVNRGPT